MRMTKKSWIIFSFIVLSISGAWIIFTSLQYAGKTDAENLYAPRDGFNAPVFHLPANTGDSIQLEDYRGYVVLLNFWGSYCHPCRTEMPAIQSVYEELSDRDFIVLAVDAPGDEANAVEFIRSNRLTFPVLFDTDGRVSGLYQVRALPTSFFIDRQGVIQKVITGGPVSQGVLRMHIIQLLED